MSNAKDSPENRLTKYQELYHLSKEVFQEELNRFANIEQKASIYMAALTFLIGLLGFFSDRILNSLLPPNDILSGVMLLLFAIILIIGIRAWFCLFRIIRIYKYKKMPVPIEFFHKNDLPTIYYTMAKGVNESLLSNRETTNQKADALDRAHRMMKALVIIIVVTFAVYTLRILIQNTNQIKKEYNMTDDPHDPQSQDTTSELQNTPEVDVAPPEFVVVTNSQDNAGDETPGIIIENIDD